MEQYLQVGIITSPHGVSGEVKVFPTTDDPRRFRRLREVFLEDKKGRSLVHINSVKFFKNMVILSFEEYRTRDSVEGLRQASLYITREQAVPLAKNEYFIADLIGLRVTDRELGLEGVLCDVYKTGANDVYDITLDDGRQLLLPSIKECILEVNPEGGYMYIHIMEGLL